MKKKLILAAIVAAFPAVASALNVSAINDYGTALAMVDPAKSLDLPTGATWTASPLVVNPDASVGGVYRSPYETAPVSSAGYFSVGTSSSYNTVANPAMLALGVLSKSIRLFWGSPDTYNSLELFRDGVQVGSVLGGQFNNRAIEASFVTISAANGTEFFDTVKFRSTSNAFEFSNIDTTPVPLPAAGWMLLAGLGGLVARSRRKNG